MSGKEAARLMGVGHETIHRWVAQAGDEVGRKKGPREWAIDVAALSYWLGSQRVEELTAELIASGAVGQAPADEPAEGGGRRPVDPKAVDAEIKLHRLAELRRETIRVDDAARMYEAELLALRTALLAIPARLSLDLDAHGQARVDTEIRSALEALALEAAALVPSDDHLDTTDDAGGDDATPDP